MTDHATKGWLDAGARVVRVLLADPKVRRDIDTVARHIEPDEAPALVRAVLWTDTSVTGTVIGSVPAVVNAGIEALRELGVQSRRLPAALVSATMDEMLARVRFRALGQATGQLLVVVIQWMRSRERGCDTAGSPFTAGMLEALRAADIEPAEALEVPLECLACRMERAVRNNPDVLDGAAAVARRVAKRHPELMQALRRAREQEAS